MRAFCAVWPGSQLPAWAVESSSDVYLIMKAPALPPACDTANWMPFTSAAVWSLDAPCSGRLE